MLLRQEKTWEETRQNFRWHVPDNFNMADFACDRWATREPDRPALLRWSEDNLTPYNYGWLAEQSRRFANALKSQGVCKGDRVAILLPQSAEVVIAHLAIYRMGAIALPLAILFGPEAIEFRLNFSGTKAILTNSEGLEKLGQIENPLPSLEAIYCTDGAAGPALDFHRAIADASDDFTRVDTTPETPGLMVFTSGTTGPPKGALHGHKVLAGHMPGVLALHEFTPQPGDRYWTPADWAWAGGLLNILMPGLALVFLSFSAPIIASTRKKPSTSWPAPGFATPLFHQRR